MSGDPIEAKTRLLVDLVAIEDTHNAFQVRFVDGGQNWSVRYLGDTAKDVRTLLSALQAAEARAVAAEERERSLVGAINRTILWLQEDPGALGHIEYLISVRDMCGERVEPATTTAALAMLRAKLSNFPDHGACDGAAVYKLTGAEISVLLAALAGGEGQ